VAGVAVVAIGFANYLSISRDVSDFNSHLGVLGATGVGMSIGSGVLMAILAGLLIACGGFVGLVRSSWLKSV
jgi:DNA helicase HerA-like ATPase